VSRSIHRGLLLIATCVAASACGDTGQDVVSVPFTGRGAAAEPFDADGWTVTLDDARIAIGPIYFCAAASSSTDLCPSAVAELTASVVVDALDPGAQPLGELSALTVDLRSAAWDFALTWPSTAAQPVLLDPSADGHSAHFEGSAVKAEQTLRFVADIDIVPLLRGARAVQGVSTRATISEHTRCELRVDAAAWWAQVQFDDLVALDGDPVRVEPESRAYEALIVAMTSSMPPTFVWSEAEDRDDR
jgi:hypothetical protein